MLAISAANQGQEEANISENGPKYVDQESETFKSTRLHKPPSSPFSEQAFFPRLIFKLCLFGLLAILFRLDALDNLQLTHSSVAAVAD